jgi:hypothetical protein
MLYTLTTPGEPHDRIRLFPDPALARGGSAGGRPVRVVAVNFDERMKRVVPLWKDGPLSNPFWYAPAESHPDGSITAKGPFPRELFLA